MSKKIGLALGGGGARGWAHVGVLRALEEHRIPIDYIAGTSIGALVGAIYVRDQLDQLEKFAEDLGMQNLVSLMDISFPGLGLIDGKRVRDFLSGYLADASLEDCRIPFRCVATNFLRKEEVVFQSGAMVDAVRASISLPGIFVPCKHHNAYLVDGGVVNPVPVNVLREMGAEGAIAVNLNHEPQPAVRNSSPSEAQSTDEQSPTARRDRDPTGAEGFTQGLVDRYDNLKDVLQDQIDDWMPDPNTGLNIFDVLGNSINMMEQQVTRVRLEMHPPDILIEPDLMEFGIFDFQQAQPMMQRGYEAAQAMMPDIQALLHSVIEDQTKAS